MTSWCITFTHQLPRISSSFDICWRAIHASLPPYVLNDPVGSYDLPWLSPVQELIGYLQQSTSDVRDKDKVRPVYEMVR